MEPHHHYGLLILAIILSVVGFISYASFTGKLHMGPDASIHAPPDAAVPSQAMPANHAPSPSSEPNNKAGAAKEKDTNYAQFYALSRGVMPLGTPYRFPACLHYHNGQLAIGPETIYSDKMIFSAHFHLKHHRKLSALLNSGGVWCGNVIAQMGESGNIAVTDFY